MVQQASDDVKNGLNELDPLRQARARAMGEWLGNAGEIVLDPGFFEVCRSHIGMDREATELAINDASAAGLVRVDQVYANQSGAPSMALHAPNWEGSYCPVPQVDNQFPPEPSDPDDPDHG